MPTFDSVVITWDGKVTPIIEDIPTQGIEKFIKKICVQPAVYWGNPRANGTGGYTFDAPKLILVRWEDKIQSLSINRGKEVTSIAEVIVMEDLKLQGMLLLNHIVEEVDAINPLNIPDAVEIIKVEKVPMIKSNSVFVRKVYVK